MTVTIPQVEASRPEALTQSAAELDRSANNLADQINRQRAMVDSLRAGWEGSASAAAIASAEKSLQRMERMKEAISRAQAVLQAGGSQLSERRSQLLGAVNQLRGQGWQVSPDGTVSVRPGSMLAAFARLSPANAMVLQSLAAKNSAALKAMLAQFDAADRQVSEQLRATTTGLGSPSSPPGSGGPAPGKAGQDDVKIPDTKDPNEIDRWWNSLTDDQRQKLLKEHPEKLGNLNGIPVQPRDQANREMMRRDIAQVTDAARSHNVSEDEVKAHPEKYGLSANDITRFTNAKQVEKGLEHNQTKANVGKDDIYLYVYEPDALNGKGRAAISIGNPDTADNTTVVVPGTSHSVAEGWLSADDAANVYNETKNADRGRSNAVVAWMGYDAPDSMTDPQVAQTGKAHAGAESLAADVNGLEATHQAGHGNHMTVIGHSYGATTVADAAAGYGMHTNDVVLLGCPGTDMAKNAGDFHLRDGGHVFVGSASSDPVTHLGGGPQVHIPGTGVTVALGADPAADGFGSTRFKAEVPGFNPKFWEDHSHYFDPGSESLFSIGDIASGHGNALQDDGMTAGHRFDTPKIPGLPIPSVEVDPEAVRPATTGHRHQ
ncbi:MULTISPECIES: alpha/beta hydrolase [unclassified Mycolicibacterium]|uniref:alpha/beta hydrolase n=1 Tax=unclassified Mycolicibacterium TaxID=2636767 RepID=UPI0012DE277A|nr:MULTISPECIES: alpha/beta hydrolase [unclassified Mycolicibacterium]MUL83108.1 hypothetical protein [Mycolicibacterium sp. CBMA 329]MUL89443.1 hypothetical protein [Mycolicibacterium sp. CBMA 331]MUL99132.1 hypothetical protein [Mycolicibacterium sp. CBMA 334]MUM24758.1 hypothetical protein [Mycolicibacterium sp. CBMA 295]MUM38959.1 hypothetical protein [Mycolicibacterium sp. CBMA 247]